MLEGDRSDAGGGRGACPFQPAENTQSECRPQRSWQRRKRRLGRLFLKKACAKKLVQDCALKLRTAEESARFLHEELLLLQLVTVGAGIIRAGAEDPGGHCGCHLIGEYFFMKFSCSCNSLLLVQASFQQQVKTHESQEAIGCHLMFLFSA